MATAGQPMLIRATLPACSQNLSTSHTAPLPKDPAAIVQLNTSDPSSLFIIPGNVVSWWITLAKIACPDKTAAHLEELKPLRQSQNPGSDIVLFKKGAASKMKGKTHINLPCNLHSQRLRPLGHLQYLRGYPSMVESKKDINDYLINYCNRYRPHQHNEGLPPIQA